MTKKLTALLLTLVLLLTMVPMLSAKNVQVTTSPFEIRLGNQMLSYTVAQKGENYQLSTGERVPFSLIYGGGTTYLPLRQVMDLLGLSTYFESTTKTIHISEGTGVTLLSGAVSGVSETKNVDLALNPSNLVIKGIPAAKAGENYTLSNGDSVPFSLLYGTGTTYLPLRKVAELFDIGIHFDAASGTIYIAKTLSPAEEALAKKEAEERALLEELKAEAALAGTIGYIRDRQITRLLTDDGIELSFVLAKSEADPAAQKVTARVDLELLDAAGKCLGQAEITLRPKDYVMRNGEATAVVYLLDGNIPAGTEYVRFAVSHPSGYFSFPAYVGAVPVAETVEEIPAE